MYFLILGVKGLRTNLLDLVDGYYGDGQSDSVEQNDQSNGEAHHNQQGPAVGNPAVHCGPCQGSREVNHFKFIVPV